ncbi:thiamine pyrophosphate-dependent enzyme [Kribbia dieselivorans]|uniref:thiamine pyrophosphate-dependent enzyme n=1 Tax=Kribbia dieselivorans TaxID=331526 RepID=UPI0008395427|nr:thiamine pyrophosphate-dependent enzyme [Kribbia dieselivorans]
MEAVDAHFLEAITGFEVQPGVTRPTDTSNRVGEAGLSADPLGSLFEAQATSRHLDFAARELQRRGEGFYTIASAGHEANAALGLLSRVDDPALLHYRSGALYCARAHVEGRVDPIRETLRSLTSSRLDPMSGGRHKVIGHPGLSIIPTTSTIGSHAPRAVGLAFALGLARRLARETPWPRDAVVLCSFGDASLNHSTVTGALNAAAYLAHRHQDCPILFVCEDNGLGISTRTPRGWVETALRHQPGVPYFVADGADPTGLLATTAAALENVRATRAPATLHLRTVRFLGHAGSDVEGAYRSARAIAADLDRDPLVATARALIESGASTADQILERYEAIRAAVARCADEVVAEPRLATRAEVVAPLSLSAPTSPRRRLPVDLPLDPPPVAAANARATTPAAPSHTLAQAINATLTEQFSAHDDLVLFGEDVAVKGGVYGVTKGLYDRFGAARVFDTILDEQTILGIALGASLAGFTPIPEIQYLAYLHNAEDQLRGEAASQRFFSAGQYENGMVLRIAGLAYQRGFGGHFHNDNSLAVLRDIPGLVLAVPSHPALAPGLLRGCLDLARREGRVCVVVEPIARYHTRDLQAGDQRWLAAPDATSVIHPGEVATWGSGTDLLIVTFGNGVFLSADVVDTLRAEGVGTMLLDLIWLAPLPVDAVIEAARRARAVLVVDETRASGGVGEGVVAALVDADVRAPIARVASADSYIPLGPAAQTVLLQHDEILDAARSVVQRSRQTEKSTP